MYRIEVGFRSDGTDVLGTSKKRELENFLNILVESVKTRRIYTIDARLQEEVECIKKELFVDPIIQVTEKTLPCFTWLIEVGYKPGVTDNVGNTSWNAIKDLLNRDFTGTHGVYTSTQYLINGPKLKYEDAEKIAKELLANELIEHWTILSYEEANKKEITIPPPIMKGTRNIVIRELDLDVSDEELVRMSREGDLALSLEELKTIQSYFKKDNVIEERSKIGLGRHPTDVEIETFAQTWSEHCKHKIFNALIHYQDSKHEETINSLFQTYIKRSTEELTKRVPWLVSVFVDNAGIISINERLSAVGKVETHNSPSALEPYGGALTGIVGVNRDPLGTGKGAKLLFNVFAYCLGDPFYRGYLPPKMLHPRRIRDGVHRGVIDGGNQSGIPLVRGREVFDQRYGLAKPLIYCGTFGVIPKEICGKPAHIKDIQPEDLIVMVGGRIGKDGIHGATFSSEELHKDSPFQAVQIGDPITQKRMSDFILEARDLGLYRSITDNGAGGLASSIGEMAEVSNGCEIDLEKAPLKYQGLNPWEILLSESQERMTVGVAPGMIDAFLELAKKRDVEATVLGKFTRSGRFHVKYGQKSVAYLDLTFLHRGVPQKKLTARWKKPLHKEPKFQQPSDLTNVLKEMLTRLNICSKEKKLRQYDHEVKGLSVVKPLVGRRHDVLSDATIYLTELGAREGLIFAEGLNPHYSDIDTYYMTASVMDEAIRRVIAVGGKLPSATTPFAALDNFCWCDPEQSEKTPDGSYKLAQLVRACKALYRYSKIFELPFVSGKDSMKNDSIVNDVKVSIPPTLMITVFAKMSDVSKAVTMDVKNPGDLVYVIGETFDELGGSEYYKLIGEKIQGKEYIGNKVPKISARKAKATYKRVSDATEKGLVHSIHTPTKGGLAVALVESSFAGNYGMSIRLDRIPHHGVSRDDTLLFSESNSRFIVTIPRENKEEFEKTMRGSVNAHIGFVVEKPTLSLTTLSGREVLSIDVEAMKTAWKRTLEAI